jgi:hypothetical protein
VDNQPPPDSYVTAVHEQLPQIIVDALDSIVARRFGAGVDIDDLDFHQGVMDIGLIAP